jgi:hypothetical protein
LSRGIFKNPEVRSNEEIMVESALSMSPMHFMYVPHGVFIHVGFFIQFPKNMNNSIAVFTFLGCSENRTVVERD